MSVLKAMDNLYYVGVLDKDLKIFDIVMTTERGTTYNSYILKGKDKTVLFEAVKDKFCDEHIEKIKEVCNPAEIDYIVCSHTEPDHTGCLKRVLDIAPKAKVLGSNTAITFLGQILNEDFPHEVVTEDSSYDLGGLTLKFFNVPMLHWPDTIYTWVPEMGALFTCDCFGCHFADDGIFNDVIGDDSHFEAAYKYYFDNIIGPYKMPHMMNALNKIKDLDIKLIATGHGPVLRTNIQYYLDLYRKWCPPPEHDSKVVVIAYVSSYGYTKALAMAIRQGVERGGIPTVRTFDLVVDNMQQAREALAEADGILLGSPTLVGDALPPIYEVMIGLNPVIHRGRFAGTFGSYGWSGEAARNVAARLNQLHMNLPLPELRVQLKPTEEDLEAARKYGEDFAKAMLA